MDCGVTGGSGAHDERVRVGNENQGAMMDLFLGKKWQANSHPGKCAACGRSTRLMVHQHCGEKLGYKKQDESKRLKRGKEAQAHYCAGAMPPWAGR